MTAPVHIGTRGSELALVQADATEAALAERHPGIALERRIIKTTGDRRTDVSLAEVAKAEGIFDKGIFIKELEQALDDGSIDIAVHSLKDMPTVLEERFRLAAVLERAPVRDVLLTRGGVGFDELPQGARVGTSSVRRAAQLKFLRPDIEIVEIRGNVPTRVKKVLGENALDAVLLAAAGLLRLGLLNANLSRIHIEAQTLHALVLDPVKFLPAAGQGAIAIECRADDDVSIRAVRSLNHAETEARVAAEREFLKILGAGCQTPVGAHTWVKDHNLHMAVRVFNEADLSLAPVERQACRPLHEAKQLAADLAAQL